MKARHHVAVQIEEEQQWQKDNGPIVKTTDQLWKYSGETEKENENYTNLLLESKAPKRPNKSRRDYFRLYWIKRKLKENKNGNNNK